MDRREYLSLMVKGCVVGSLVGFAVPSKSSVLRPPGAVDDFLSLCSRCGLCANSCPYPTLNLAGLLDNAENGTPFIDPQVFPCQMCKDIPCASHCPTGALIKPTVIEDARMGLAEVKSTCLTLNGEACNACEVACPIEAIKMSSDSIPQPVVQDNCTGCGKCEYACVTSRKSIIVIPS